MVNRFTRVETRGSSRLWSKLGVHTRGIVVQIVLSRINNTVNQLVVVVFFGFSSSLCLSPSSSLPSTNLSYFDRFSLPPLS